MALKKKIRKDNPVIKQKALFDINDDKKDDDFWEQNKIMTTRIPLIKKVRIVGVDNRDNDKETSESNRNNSLVEINIPAKQLKSVSKEEASQGIITEEMTQESLYRYIENMSKTLIDDLVNAKVEQKFNERLYHIEEINNKVARMSKVLDGLDSINRKEKIDELYEIYKTIPSEDVKLEAPRIIKDSQTSNSTIKKSNGSEALRKMIEESKNLKENDYIIFDGIRYDSSDVIAGLKLLEKEKIRQEAREIALDFVDISSFRATSKIREIIEYQGKKLNWLQEQTGIKKSTFNAIINNINTVSLDNSLKISTILKMNVEDVFNFEPFVENNDIEYENNETDE